MPGNNLTYNLVSGGAATTATYGPGATGFGGSSGALSLNASYYVTVPAAVFPSGTNISITVRFNMSTAQTGNYDLVNFIYVSNQLLMDVELIGGKVRFRGYGGFSLVSPTANQYNDGNWHTAVCVMTATNVYLYVDGTLITSAANTYVATTCLSAAIGYDQANGIEAASGYVDEVSIWNIALSGTPNSSPYLGGETGLVALYHFDGNGNDSSLTALSFASAPNQAPYILGLPQINPSPDSTTQIPTAVTISSGNINGGNGVYTYNLYVSATPGFTPGAGNLVSSASFNTYTYTPPDGSLYYCQYVITDSGGGTISTQQTAFQLKKGVHLKMTTIGDSLFVHIPNMQQVWIWTPPGSGTGISMTYNGNTLAGTSLLNYNDSAATIQTKMNNNAGGANSGLGVNNQLGVGATVAAITGTTSFVIRIPALVQNSASFQLSASAGTIFQGDTQTSAGLATLLDAIVTNLQAGRTSQGYATYGTGNGAIAGQTSTQWAVGGSNYTNWKANINGNGYNLVVIMLGTNDAGSDVRTSAATYLSNLTGIINDILSWTSPPRILLLYPPCPTPGASANMRKWDGTSVSLMTQYHAQIDAIINPSNYPAYVGKVYASDRTMFNITAQNPSITDDGIHPAVAALQIWGARIANYIENIFEGVTVSYARPVQGQLGSLV